MDMDLNRKITNIFTNSQPFQHILISPFFFPGILYEMPRLPEQYLEKKNSAHSPVPGNHKNHIAPLEAEYLQSIGEKADQFMRNQRPFLQQDFNLVELAVEIDIPVHHLAYFFREEKMQSFTNYRNHWRIEYAKDLIKNGKAKDLTLEAIGILSGFTNRNSFIIAFKRFEGVPPHEYSTQSGKG